MINLVADILLIAVIYNFFDYQGVRLIFSSYLTRNTTTNTTPITTPPTSVSTNNPNLTPNPSPGSI